MRQLTRVRKRDGREESFDHVRLTVSIRCALGSSETDIALAAELAEAVTSSLLGSGVVETTDLAAAVETTLAQCGYPQACKAFRQFRQRQQEHLQRVRVHVSHGREDHARPWDRRRLALGLMRDRHLDLQLAGQVSRRVERRVIGTDSIHLTGHLVSSLADNECRTLGLRGGDLAADKVGLGSNQLGTWLGGGVLPSVDGGPSLASPGHDPRALLGGQLLRRFALQDILSSAQANAIIEGKFDIPALGDFTRPARTLLRPVASESEQAFWRRVGEELGRAHEVQVHWPARRTWSDISTKIPNWIHRPDCRLSLFTDDPELAREWIVDGNWTRLSLAAFLQASSELRGMLAGSNRCLLYWSSERDQMRRARGIESQLGSVVMNLAAPARAATNTSDFLDRVAESCDLACNAIKILGDRAGKPTPNVSLSILPAGLPQTMDCLLGPASNQDSATRLLLNLRSRLAQSAKHAGLELSHYSPPHPESSGSHLALRDAFVEHGGYAVGWSPAEAAPIPPEAAFRSVPWLQFPAASALHHPGLARWAEVSATP